MQNLLILLYAVVLSGSNANPDFKGFLIQGRIVADGTTTAGEFIVNGDDQQIRCDGDVSTSSYNYRTIASKLIILMLCSYSYIYCVWIIILQVADINQLPSQLSIEILATYVASHNFNDSCETPISQLASYKA